MTSLEMAVLEEYGKKPLLIMFMLIFSSVLFLKWTVRKVTNKIYWYFLTESGCYTSLLVEAYVFECVNAGEVRILKAWDLR